MEERDNLNESNTAPDIDQNNMPQQVAANEFNQHPQMHSFNNDFFSQQSFAAPNIPPQNFQNIPPYMQQFQQNMPVNQKVRPENTAYAEMSYTDSMIQPSKKSIVQLCVILIILALFTVGVFALGYFGAIKPDSSKSVVQLMSRPEEGEKYTIEEIAEYVRPAIVEIYCFSQKISSDEVDAAAAYATGSGVIISEEGYIVTNQHVIGGAAQIEVVLCRDSSSGNEPMNSYTARVVGYDSKTDLAVIRINATDLDVAVFGDAHSAVLGEQVVAIGNPSGYAGTLTTGIISGLERKIRTESTGYDMTCIQTDAPISPGNSGGALVNMYGQVIGITSSKIADTNVEGIGFAITVNEAKPIIDDIIEYGYVRGRYRIGIEFYGGFYDDTYAVSGVYITGIREDSDVYNTELKIGDIITEMNGVPVADYDEINEALEGCVAGDRVKAKVVRINEDSSVEEFEIEFELIEDKSGDY